MREQEKRKLIRKIKDISGANFGEPLYLRPFETDDKTITDIARVNGLKKSAVAQKLLHLALAGKTYDFTSEKKEQSKLDWLINNEKHKRIQQEVSDARLERLEEHARVMENLSQAQLENSNFIRLLISEIYCLINICMSFLNLIFIKLIEYFSPVEIEKKNSTNFANRIVLELIAHSLSELDKIVDHHNLDPGEVEPEMLYLFTKIEKIKAKLVYPSNHANSETK